MQDKDAFLQAAKRTPVDLQEWAISMMERHNRKSYLAPPAPKSLKEGTTPSPNTPSSAAAAAAATPVPAPVPKQTPTITTSKPLRTPQQSQPSPYQQNPSSGESKIANDVSSPHRYYGSQGYHYSSSSSTRSPAPPSLEHLSLETKDDESRSGRQTTRYLGDPVSAIEAPSRPFMSPRSVSSNNTKRTNLTSTTLPIRAAPPPKGPPPPPPVSAGGNWRGYPGQMPGTSS